MLQQHQWERATYPKQRLLKDSLGWSFYADLTVPINLHLFKWKESLTDNQETGFC